MIKNIYKSICIALPLILVAGACEDPEQEVFDQIPRDVILNSTDPDVLAVLAASAYSPLASYNWGSHNSLWTLNEIASDEMLIPHRGADWEDGRTFIRIHRHEYLPTEGAVGGGWGYCYGAIATVNNLIKQFEGNETLTGELEVLRALVYLWLIDSYGNVPIITEKTEDSTPGNNTRQEVFDFIELSILDNIHLLRQERTYATINYYVAQTMLAKLYLNAEIYTGTARWQDAVDAANEVIDAGVYSLEPNFFENFSSRNQNSSENIFVINYDKDNAQGFFIHQMTLHYSSQATFDLQQQPWNGYSTLEDFYNSFDSDDVRINSFFVGPQFSLSGERLMDLSAEPEDPDGEPLTFTPHITELTPGALRQEGARIAKFEIPVGIGPNLSNDYPIYRYSDVLLIKAEALWRLNPGDGTALDLVNQVRSRAGLDGFGTLTAENLLAERGREFFAEGWRRSDLIRFGKYNDPWWEKPASDASKNIFPIPQGQIDVNTDLVQNPGY